MLVNAQEWGCFSIIPSLKTEFLKLIVVDGISVPTALRYLCLSVCLSVCMSVCPVVCYFAIVDFSILAVFDL